MLFYGLLDLSLSGYVIITLIFTQISIATVTLFLHRAQAHRSLKLHPIMSHFFRFWLWATTGMVTKAWVAIHRKHHAKCETPEDPHSPQVLGLGTVLGKGSELYRLEAANTETLARYGDGTPDDWLERNVYNKHHVLGIMSMLTANIILFGIPGIIIWSLQMAWMPMFAAGIINGVGHYFGYRNFDCPDASTNIVPWGFIIGGEELHNNHHAYPTSSKFSIKWWEFDIGWLYIRLLQSLGLAKPLRVAPKILSVAHRTLDGDTLKALISNRFQVMAHYMQQVMRPALKAEVAVAKRTGAKETAQLLKVAGKSLKKEAICDNWSKAQVAQILSNHDSLSEVYHFKTRLQAIWNHTSATQKELLEALHQWCTEAEATGMKALQDFSRYLKGYHALKRA